MQVDIRRLQTMRVACVRHVGPYAEAGAAWDYLLAAFGQRGIPGDGRCRFGIGHDDPRVTPPDALRYDACIEVDEDYSPPAGVGIAIVEGGEFAVTTHRGPYCDIGGTYAALYEHWLPSSGRTARAAPAMEFYLNNPYYTAPADLVTEIYLPLKPVSRGS